jgi:carbamoyl-phosphate synthase large subunit
MTNILLSCAGRRHYLAGFFVDALGGDGRVVGTDMDPTAPALTACDRQRLVPAVAAPDYLRRLIEVIREEEVDMVFSLNDLELELLARNRTAIEASTGATVYVASERCTSISADKWLTFQFAADHDIPAPATFLDVKSAKKAIAAGQCSAQMIVKPRWGSASIGLVRVDDAAELEAAYHSCRDAVAGSALSAFGLNQAVIIQERIDGPEYGVDILYGRDEGSIGFAAKRKLSMRAGETDKAVTVEPDRFQYSVEKISRNLLHRGNLDCDFLERDGKLLLLEMNPRFGGGYPFTHMAGANHVAMLLADFAGNPLPGYGYDVGRTFAKYDRLTEVLP